MFEDYRWLMLASCAALTACAGTAGLLRAPETYSALGHNPGWLLTIQNKKLKFVTSSPSMVYESPLALPETTPRGRRYSTDGVTLDITSRPCNDARSGIAFADTVVVSVSGSSDSYRGCGGERVPLLDR
jgi:uncharacterized membrane protein